uniref:Uncharacterized protein n=1 Tax=Leersia perrieri TaxID=77586 RepID=A0A0D9VXR7_9ORYZ
MAVGAEVGNHRCDRSAVENAVNSKQMYGDNMGFVSPPCAVNDSKQMYGDNTGFVSPPCAVGTCPYTPFFYVPAGVATTTTTVRNNVTFANGTAVATPPAPATKRARGEGQLQIPGLDGRAKQRKLINVVDPHVGVDQRWLRHAMRDQGADQVAERQRRRHAMALLVDAARQVAAKNAEIERTRSLVRALEARLRGMHAQALAWRGVALSSQAEAAALRSDLERALQRPPSPGETADAESCCYGDNGVDVLGGGEEEVGSDCCLIPQSW